MGKVRHRRTRLHATAAKLESKSDSQNVGEYSPRQAKVEIGYKTGLPLLSENPFSNLTISQTQLRQTLDTGNNEEQNESKDLFIIEKNRSEVKEKNVRLDKKGKRLQKRKQFIEKLKATKTAEEKRIKAKKRANVPVVGDLKPMELALSDINKIINNVDADDSNVPVEPKSKRKKKSRKPRRLKRQQGNSEPLEKFKTIDDKGMSKIQSKRTQKHMIYEINRFKKLISDSSFKSTIMNAASDAKLSKTGEVNNNSGLL